MSSVKCLKKKIVDDLWGKKHFQERKYIAENELEKIFVLLKPSFYIYLFYIFSWNTKQHFQRFFCLP